MCCDIISIFSWLPGDSQDEEDEAKAITVCCLSSLFQSSSFGSATLYCSPTWIYTLFLRWNLLALKQKRQKLNAYRLSNIWSRKKRKSHGQMCSSSIYRLNFRIAFCITVTSSILIIVLCHIDDDDRNKNNNSNNCHYGC